MPTYVIPAVRVFQQFNLVPQAEIRELCAHIAGGHAYLARYSDTDEKAASRLGYYDSLAETCYSWPNRPAGALVDASYTKVFIDNALLRYFQDTIGAGDSILTVAGEVNRVRAAATNFKANGTAYPRDADLLDRDVQLGDTVKVRAVVGSDDFTLWSYVAGFVADPIDPVVNAATSDSGNAATQSAPTPTFLQTAGPENCVAIDSVDQSAYDGLADGDINETYTITVTQSSVGGDATTARLRVTSASGNDNDSEVIPSAFGLPTAIGSRGLDVVFENTLDGGCSLASVLEGYSPDDFVLGQTFRVTCGQAFTKPVPTSGGDYEGEVDLTYIIEVTLGGTYAGSVKPQITVRTNKGLDVSGPTTVTAAATAVAVGTLGVTVEFSGTALRKGDRYYIECEAESDGPYRTLVLGHNLAEEVQDNGATAVDLTLYIRKNIEVSKNRTGFAPLTNWTQSETEICLQSGIIAYDDSWTDDGDPQPLNVYSEASQDYGAAYVEYRAWLSDLCDEVVSVTVDDDLDDVLSGPLHPDNPLKYGVFKARQNSNGTPVRATAVCDPDDPDSWANVLDLLDGRDDVYGLVPLTRLATVLSLYQTHVNNQSAATAGRWRVAWFNLPGISAKAIVHAATSSDKEEVLALISDDPLTSGTQYTYLTVPGGNGKFITNGAQPGDLARTSYSTDGFGSETYDSYTIDAVLNEDTLRLLTGPSAAVTVPQKIEIWRTLSATQEAEAIAAANTYEDRRIRTVWPDELVMDGFTVPGWFLCAALSGLSSGVVPQQGLTHLEIAGIDSVDRADQHFNRTQQDILALAGAWIVIRDRQGGAVFSRHALTSGDYDDINQREEMVTRNVDSISYFLLEKLDPYIGVSNVTESTIAVIRAELRSALQFLLSSNFVARLGGQLRPGSEIVELRPHSTLRDRLLASISLALPYPLNNVDLTLVV